MRQIDSSWLLGELKIEKADLKTYLQNSVFKKKSESTIKGKDDNYYYMNVRDGKTLPTIS